VENAIVNTFEGINEGDIKVEDFRDDRNQIDTESIMAKIKDATAGVVKNLH
jgi:hypothetical protein